MGHAERIKEAIEKGFEEYFLPDYMLSGILLYVFEGIAPGGFLTAVLENDFQEACMRADHNNVQCLHGWAMLTYNRLPAACHGNREKVGAWRGLDWHLTKAEKEAAQ